jgi:hypothetical protein
VSTHVESDEAVQRVIAPGDRRHGGTLLSDSGKMATPRLWLPGKRSTRCRGAVVVPRTEYFVRVLIASNLLQAHRPRAS